MAARPEPADDSKVGPSEASVEEGVAQAGKDGDAREGTADEAKDDEFGIIGETPKVSEEEFFRRAAEKTAIPERGDTQEEQMHWTHPRRWKVRLWAIQIENTIKDNHMFAFANFVFGGTREEFQVKPGGGSAVILVAGDEGREVRTPVMEDIPGDGVPAVLDFDESFEWHGSYADLEHQSLRVELWNWSRYRVNKFDSYHQEPLVNFARGNILNEVECIKMNRFGKRLVRARMSFKLYFQEIYDFTLTFISWRAVGLLNCAQTLGLLSSGDENPERRSGRAHSIRGSMASIASVASASGTSMRVEVAAPWLRSWCCCGIHGRSFMSRAAPCSSGSAEWREWAGRSLRFRGTCSELNSLRLEATVFSAESYRVLRLPRAPRGSRRAGIPLCTSTVRLKGVLEHGQVQANLVPAAWLYQVQGGQRAKKHDSGTLHGHVVVEHQPRFQQKEDLAGDLDLGKRYLFVHVIKVDRVVTPDMRPTSDIDTYVEVVFDGKSQRSRVQQDTSSPHFDDVLVFEISLARTAAIGEAAGAGADQPLDVELVWEEIENKGPVHFDLWTSGPICNDHLGSCEVFPSETLTDERGHAQKAQKKMAKDKDKKEEEEFDVRILRGQKQLSFIWGEGGASNLFFEMWFLPDLGKNARLKKVRRAQAMPKSLAGRFSHLQQKWQQKTSSLCSEGRQFPCVLPNQWATESFFLPRFLDVLKPPRGLGTCNAISHFVGCVPYFAKKAEAAMAYTPDFFARIKQGDALDHALLQVGLLLGMGKHALVCLGTDMQRKAHAWVATLEAGGTVKFWEPYLGVGTRQLPRRLAHPEVLTSPQLPKSLPEEVLKMEVDRRKRLALRQESEATTLCLHAPNLHEHPLSYADVSTGVKVETTCAGCKAVGASWAFVRGFLCREGCHYALCWRCAEPHWGDRSELDGLTFDPTEPVAFEETTQETRGLAELQPGVGLRHKLGVPYRSLEVVFNNTNCWANLQHRDPRRILWDLWNPHYWHAFAPKTSGLRPCFPGCRFPDRDRDEAWIAQQKRQLLRQLQSALRSRRSARNLDTHWVRTPSLAAFLELGLKLRMKLDTCGEEELETYSQELQDWEQALAAKTPPRHCLRGAPLHFGFCDATLVAQEALDLCGLTEAREKSTQFALAVHLRPLPGEVVSLYVFICSLHRLTDLEATEEAHHRELLRAQGKGAQLLNLLHRVVQSAKEQSLKEGPSMSGFDEALHSRYVRVSTSSRGQSIATYVGSKQGSSYQRRGGIMGNGPIAAADEGKYFEVEVLKVCTGHRSGMAIGVTGRPPASVAEDWTAVPDTMDKVASSWLAGFEGKFWDGSCAKWMAIEWCPKDLAVGDRVGCLVEYPGRVTILVNGKQACSWSGDIPVAAPLYAVVDLIGNTDAVLLHLHARPRQTLPETQLGVSASAAPAPAPTSASATTSVNAQGPERGGTALPARPPSPAPVPVEHKQEQAAVHGGGTVLPARSPSPAPAPPSGHISEPPSQRSPGPAEPPAKRPDRVSATALAAPRRPHKSVAAQPPPAVEPGQQAKAKTRTCETEGRPRVPVDLLHPAGQADPTGSGPDEHPLASSDSDHRAPAAHPPKRMTQTRLGQHAQKPPSSQPAADFDVGSDEEVLRPEHATERPSVLRASYRGSREPQKRPSQLRQPSPEESAAESDTVAKGPKQNQTLPIPIGLMRGFSLEDLGSELVLSDDHLAATLREGAAEVGPCGGLVFGDGSLVPTASGNFAFAVCVATAWPDCQEGLALGVTTRRPGTGGRRPESADQAAPSWFVGYDGATWNGAKKEWQVSTWTPTGLRAGDVVELHVTPAGDMQILVNGARHARHTMGVPTSAPLFALVELLGGTRGVRLRDPSGSGVDKARLPATVEQVREEPAMRGFHRTRLGALVSLSADGCTASRAKAAEGDSHCVLLGDGPLKPNPQGGVAFSIRVTSCEAGHTNGLAVGLTTRRPGDVGELPETADQVSPSWLVGYDGATWDGGRGAWGFSGWNPAGVRPGDVVELRAHPGTNVQVLVNQVEQAVHPLQVPSSQLFALVDLQGGVKSVSLLSAEQLPASAPVMTQAGAFSRTSLGRSLVLSPDALTATRIAGAPSGSGCVLITNGTLQGDSDGSTGFAVTITAVSKASEGVALGVTQRSPAEVGPPPPAAEGVAPCWLVGFDGATWNGSAKEWGLSIWIPDRLAVQDVVSVRVSQQGDLSVSVNEEEFARHPMHIPLDRPLFGLLDLGGRVSGVTWSAARKADAVPLPTGSKASMLGFCPTKLGKSLELSKDRRSVSCKAKTGSSTHAVLLGDAALPRGADGATSYEISIGAVSSRAADGLAVGVTTQSPEAIRALPPTADKLAPSWLLGFDSASWNGSVWGFSHWDPRTLRSGDTLKVTVTGSGQLGVLVNSKSCDIQDLQIPIGKPLFALLDLGMHVTRLSLLSSGPSPGRSGSRQPARSPRVSIPGGMPSAKPLQPRPADGMPHSPRPAPGAGKMKDADERKEKKEKKEKKEAREERKEQKERKEPKEKEERERGPKVPKVPKEHKTPKEPKKEKEKEQKEPGGRRASKR